MSLRRFVVLFRGLGYVFNHAPSSPQQGGLGASPMPDVVRTHEGATVTSLQGFVRAMKNPQGVFGG